MKAKRIYLFFLFFLLITSCTAISGSGSGNDQPVSSTELPTSTPATAQAEFEFGEVENIESLDVLFLESFPLQATVRITGYLPDSCSVVDHSEVTQTGNNFEITIFTKREKQAVCAAVLTPFEKDVPLDVYGLLAGTYRVMVLDKIVEFVFEQDNVPAESGGG